MNVEVRCIFSPPFHESQGTMLRSPGLQDKYFPPPSHLAHPTPLFLSYHKLLASSTLHNGAGEACGSTGVMNTTRKAPLLNKVELIFPTKPSAASPAADEERRSHWSPPRLCLLIPHKALPTQFNWNISAGPFQQENSSLIKPLSLSSCYDTIPDNWHVKK